MSFLSGSQLLNFERAKATLDGTAIPNLLSYGVTLNTVPSSLAPPKGVVPNKFPDLSKTMPPQGLAPSPVAPKLWRMMYAPDDVISNTMPATLPLPPPARVVPYRFPEVSMTRPL